LTIEVTRAGTLTVRRADGQTLFFAPVSSGSEHDPLPEGSWKVTGVGWLPPFHYNPDLFWDAKATHTKATIQPGPNNPVGVTWIDLNLEHYGLHGTPEPGRIGCSSRRPVSFRFPGGPSSPVAAGIGTVKDRRQSPTLSCSQYV